METKLESSTDAPLTTDPTDRSRRRRWERDGSRRIYLNAKDAALLLCLTASRFLTTHQLMEVSGFSPKATRNHGRRIYDAGVAERIHLPPALYHGTPYGGSAPEVYCLTEPGASWLVSHGYLAERPRVPDARRKSLTFLPHELLLSEVRAWACRNARARGQEVLNWREGQEATLPGLRPDGMFAVRTLSFVEADRDTEDEATWRSKAVKYAALFADPARMEQETGFRTATVLVVCPGAARRDRIAAWLSDSPIAPRFRVAAADALSGTPTDAVWRIPGVEGIHPLVRETGQDSATSSTAVPAP